MAPSVKSPSPTAAPPNLGAPSLRCIACRRTAAQPEPDFRCKHCGELQEVVYTGLEPGAPGASRPDPAHLKSLWRERKGSTRPEDRSGVWRFREMLPILADTAGAVTLAEGNTPLYELPRCARSAGVQHLLAKHLGMNPTGSFKDTGMTAALSVAQQAGFRWVGCASTGNTSASMAAYAARAGMRALVLIPEGKIAWSKLSQSLDYGAHTLQLQTDFDGCFRVLQEAVHQFPIYLLNSVNPYRLEGQKTVAFELMEQLEWRVPQHVIVPGGNLGNSSALGKGFLEMQALGLIDRLPRISIIQAAGANPLVQSVHRHDGQRLEPVQEETRATAIRIGNPASWRKAVAVLRHTSGACLDVSEEEIAIAKAEIGADGIGCEPASATTLAGLKKLVRSGFVQAEEPIVLVLTGHVLKDPEYTLDFHRNRLEAAERSSEAASLRRPPQALEPDVRVLVRTLERLGA